MKIKHCRCELCIEKPGDAVRNAARCIAESACHLRHRCKFIEYDRIETFDEFEDQETWKA